MKREENIPYKFYNLSFPFSFSEFHNKKTKGERAYFLLRLGTSVLKTKQKCFLYGNLNCRGF
jgi:hypothetical protein